ncbi:hypothetical protein Cni_G17581 [Canna indica]|uniref:PNPLA domain-containing protein n=1 Tax=Canna indica TaxID=4628 RepID=A0AAQ3KKT7_9LILI|nr:hypothetical protein Cni_G17581 [Canna indica]
MQGILPEKVLAYLEHAIRSKSGNPDARIFDYFNLAAGTGVGGVLAAMLAVFFGAGDGRISSATDNMERLMKEAFGETLTLHDTVKPVLIPCYDLQSSAPLVFSCADALESDSYNFRLWEVCRATLAETGHFEPAEIRSVDRVTSCVGVDGGMAMSNPAATAIKQVESLHILLALLSFSGGEGRERGNDGEPSLVAVVIDGIVLL